MDSTEPLTEVNILPQIRWCSLLRSFHSLLKLCSHIPYLHQNIWPCTSYLGKYPRWISAQILSMHMLHLVNVFFLCLQLVPNQRLRICHGQSLNSTSSHRFNTEKVRSVSCFSCFFCMNWPEVVGHSDCCSQSACNINLCNPKFGPCLLCRVADLSAPAQTALNILCGLIDDKPDDIPESTIIELISLLEALCFYADDQAVDQ